MKILHLSSARSFGGGERHLADLVRCLAAREHQVSVVLAPGSPLIAKLSVLAPENICALRMRNALDLIAAQRLSRIIKEREIDIVHAHLARDYPLAALAVNRRQSARLIFTRHVLFPLNWLHRVTFVRAARVIAVSEAVAKSLRAQRLCPPEKIVCIKNGIDLDRFRQGADETLTAISSKVATGTYRVGMLGEISLLKGQELFIRAAALLAERFPSAQFLIAGEDVSRDGATRRRVVDLINNHNLTDRVQIVGRVENAATYLSSLDVFVSASHAESFGLAIVEALACGAPVVSTATAGATEIIKDGVNGLIVPIDDAPAIAEAIGALLENAGQRQNFICNGLLSVKENFSLRRMIDETERLYKEVCNLH